MTQDSSRTGAGDSARGRFDEDTWPPMMTMRRARAASTILTRGIPASALRGRYGVEADHSSAGQVPPHGPRARWPGKIIAVGVAAGVCLAWPNWAAKADDTALAVTVVTVKQMCFVDTLQVTGVLVPRHEILVRPVKEGLEVKEILVQLGDSVISGQVLARLKPADGSKDSGDDFSVKAPAAGTIYAMSAAIGAIAASAGEPLFRIAQDGEMELSATTPVNTMQRLAQDQTATVQVIGVGELPGKVQLVSTAINQTTQLGEVRIFVGADRRLRVGAFGRGMISIERRCEPAIPLSAVLYGSGDAFVQVVRDNRIETRRVRVGLIKGGNAEIQEGLAIGDTVVARAGAFVRDGDRVRSIAAAEPPR
jgi:multidrug efflux pump subunit AcrA (membrane-fusion protein)